MEPGAPLDIWLLRTVWTHATPHATLPIYLHFVVVFVTIIWQLIGAIQALYVQKKGDMSICWCHVTWILS